MNPKLLTLNKKHFFALWLFLIIGIISFEEVLSQPIQNQPFDDRLGNDSTLFFKSSKMEARARFWVDSVMQGLSIEQRIAQLMMARTYSNRDDDFNNSIDQLITRFGIGGLCFFQGTAERQKELTKDWQDCSAVPLFIALDAENGPGMRLTGAFTYPDFMTMGALTNDSLIGVAGFRVGQMCTRLGVHINFSPVADVNNNPLNPVIHMRSFGEIPEKVAEKSTAFALGLQDAGVMATAKHFPGHGDTDSDSHFTIPVLNKSVQQLDSTELIPFRRLVQAGVGAVMVGHLTLPLLDTTRNLAATFSEPIVANLLQKNLGFGGLVITDGLDMKGATLNFGPGEPALRALMAGSDILLLPSDIPKAIETISKALTDSLISPELIDHHCRRVLMAKYLYIIESNKLIARYPDADAAGTAFDRALNRRILKESAILVTNRQDLLPLLRPDTIKMAVVSCGIEAINSFTDLMKAYAPVDVFTLPEKATAETLNLLAGQLSTYDLIVLQVATKMQGANKDYGVPQGTSALNEQLVTTGRRVIVALFGSPYGATRIAASELIAALIVSPDNSSTSQELVPQMIFGALPFKGILPVSLGSFKAAGSGITTVTVDRLQYVIPEELGMKPEILAGIDSIARQGIRAGAYPGCQIQFALDGKVFYRKAFGTPQYEVTTPVKITDVYDLASLTKIFATTLGVMKLTDQDEIDIHHKLSDYLPGLEHSNKAKIRIIDIMTHQAGLQPWIPFYRQTIAQPQQYYRDSLSITYSIKVADRLFLRLDYRDSIMNQIIQSPVNSDKSYKYSDLGFILLKEAVEKITDSSFDRWLDANFYAPLSLNTMGFKPWTKYPSGTIMPTEDDHEWRKQLVHGYVHDQAAAMMGGVSGHAGLFGNANDATIVMQMLLQKGSYGGQRFIKQTTIREFCKAPFADAGNHRGIGFDKPPLHPVKDGPVCGEASSKSFGHSGFTGTYVWADPGNMLVYTFLSNRVYPLAENKKLSQMNIRTRIHSVAYKAVRSAQKPNLTSYPRNVNPYVLLINNSKMGLLFNSWR